MIVEADFAFYAKMDVPPPTFCPICRFQRRCAFRNEHTVFWNVSAKSGKRILSLYPKASRVAVYDDDEWRSDDWDPMAYGRDYDFSRPFFEQMHELAFAVPRVARSNEGNLRCDYVANSGRSKDCYLLFNTTEAENCAYGNAMDYCKDCFEGSHCKKCERSYESFWNVSCYRAHFSSRCEACTDVWFCKNCRNCTNCFGCVNLRNKQYWIWNKPVGKEVFEKTVADMGLHAHTGVERAKQQAHLFWAQNPIKYMEGSRNERATGDFISQSRDVHRSYLIRGGENLRYCQYLLVPPNKDCMDITVWGAGNEWCYENSICGWGVHQAKFCIECWPEVRNAEYCMFCKNVADSFGCVGIKNKQHCILNKQYTKAEYEILTLKIKQHMNDVPYVDKKGNSYRYGEFFPIEHAPFGGNTSIVNEHFAISRDEALASGYPWDESERGAYEISLQAAATPDSIHDVSENIIEKIIGCTRCGSGYRVIGQELRFLKAEQLPVPRLCVNCRHYERISQRSRYGWYARRCMCGGTTSCQPPAADNQLETGIREPEARYVNTVPHYHHGTNPCPVEFETSYAPERQEIVYCEACYNQEVA